MPVTVEALRGQRCFGGLDLSSTIDLASLIWIFPDIRPWPVLCRFWTPSAELQRRVRRDRAPYDVWSKQGHIELVEGAVVDQRVIRRRLNEDGDRFAVAGVGYDPWNATQLAGELEEDGFTMVQVRQGYATMSEPTKAIEKDVLARALDHGGHPVLRWCASNVAITQDAAGNIKPAKDKSTGRIDGIVALIMARYMMGTNPEKAASVYERRGLAATASEGEAELEEKLERLPDEASGRAGGRKSVYDSPEWKEAFGPKRRSD